MTLTWTLVIRLLVVALVVGSSQGTAFPQPAPDSKDFNSYLNIMLEPDRRQQTRDVPTLKQLVWNSLNRAQIERLSRENLNVTSSLTAFAHPAQRAALLPPEFLSVATELEEIRIPNLIFAYFNTEQIKAISVNYYARMSECAVATLICKADIDRIKQIPAWQFDNMLVRFLFMSKVFRKLVFPTLDTTTQFQIIRMGLVSPKSLSHRWPRLAMRLARENDSLEIRKFYHKPPPFNPAGIVGRLSQSQRDMLQLIKINPLNGTQVSDPMTQSAP